MNTNQNTSMDRNQSHASFYEDLLSKIEELKKNDLENEKSSESEEISKTKLLENLQEILLKHNRKSDFIFMLLLQSMITKVLTLPVSLYNFRFLELIFHWKLALRRIAFRRRKNKMWN